MSEPLLSMNDSIANSADPEFDVFLSHNSKEKPTVKRIAEKLRCAGIKPWLDIWHLPDGGDWQTGLANGLRASSACAVFIGRHDVGDWQRLEQQFATDRMAKDRAFRVFLVLLPGLPDPFDTGTLPPFLTLRNWVDLRKGIEDARAFQSLINAIKGVPSDSERSPEPRNDICPYRGLQTFDEEHAEFFFGRDGDIQRLVEKLKGLKDGQSLIVLRGHSGEVKSAVFSPNGKRIMSGGVDGSARIWESRGGRVVAELRKHTAALSSVAFSPDGNLAVTASLDSKALVWDVSGKNVVLELIGHRGRINSASFSPNGLLVITAGNDLTARIWDIRKAVYDLAKNLPSHNQMTK